MTFKLSVTCFLSYQGGWSTWLLSYSPNTIKSPKHAAHGVAQSPYPIYRDGKACFSKQPLACSPGPSPSTRQVPGSSPGPGGCAARAFFSTLPLSSFGRVFFRTFPTQPTTVLGLLYTTGWVYYNPNTIKSYKILQKLSSKHAAHGVAQSPYPIYRHGKACLSKQPPWRAAPDPRLARGRSWVRAPDPAGALRALFSPPSLPSSFFSHLPHQTHESVRVIGLIIINNFTLHHQA